MRLIVILSCLFIAGCGHTFEEQCNLLSKEAGYNLSKYDNRLCRISRDNGKTWEVYYYIIRRDNSLSFAPLRGQCGQMDNSRYSRFSDGY